MIVFHYLQRDQDFKNDPVTGFSNAFVQRQKSFRTVSEFVNWMQKSGLTMVEKKEDAIAYELVFDKILEYESILINKYDSLQELTELFMMSHSE